MTYLSHGLHDAEFLSADEAFQHQPDRHVDVILVDSLAQV